MDCWFNLNEQFVLLELKEDICLFDKNYSFFCIDESVKMKITLTFKLKRNCYVVKWTRSNLTLWTHAAMLRHRTANISYPHHASLHWSDVLFKGSFNSVCWCEFVTVYACFGSAPFVHTLEGLYVSVFYQRYSHWGRLSCSLHVIYQDDEYRRLLRCRSIHHFNLQCDMTKPIN